MPLKIIHTKNLKWVDIVNPKDEEINYLKDNFRFHPLDFEDLVSSAIRVKIDEYDEYLFIVLLFPFLHKDSGEIKPAEVDFFVGKNFVVTIHDGTLKTLSNLVHNVHQYDNVRAQYMTDGPGLLVFSILELLFKRSNPILDRLNHEIIVADKNIFKLDLDTLEQLSKLKKNIITYRRIMKMHRYVLAKLARSKKDYLKFSDSHAYFQNLIEYAENIWDVLTADKETLESFEETNQTLSGHRINDILQILTIVSVIVSILTLITDVLIFFERGNLEKNYGLGGDFQLLVFITSILIFVTAVLLKFFKNRKWL